jgi:hypothetical protein
MILTEIKYIFIPQDYENFAESTKRKVAPTLACSNHLVRQAKVEQPPSKCFWHRNFQMPASQKCI